MTRIDNKPRQRVLLAAAAILAISVPQKLTAGGVIDIPFNASNFPNPLVIDNDFLPLVPGTTQTYKAEGPDGCEVDVFTVTNDEKTITIGESSIQVRVIEDLAYEDDECNGPDPTELVEKTFDWHGQDNAGNVWYFGEQTFNCEGAGSCAVGSGSWEAGKDLAGVGVIAKPGIVMLANPKMADQYYQEFYPGFAEDQARISGLGVKVVLKRDDAISLDPSANCIKTKEWSKLSPGDVEEKYYCEGIGNVAVDEHHGKKLRFELVGPEAGASNTTDAFRFRKPPGSR
jgi:hypothetical protein